ncbi:MAG TPA: hypothetical protein VM532_16730 [Burkholderiales bacterium]|jgi:REP element-mobilizing transposase RayT|nr:hypothetical protein [Burkholderiales bacterium]
MVILPDHLHGIWTLPPDDGDFPVMWAPIEAGFVFQSNVAFTSPLEEEISGEAQADAQLFHFFIQHYLIEVGASRNHERCLVAT